MENKKYKLTKGEFLKFHSEYFGEEVDNIKQIVRVSFTGQEIFEYLNQVLSMYDAVERSKLSICYKEEIGNSRCGYQCIECGKGQ